MQLGLDAAVSERGSPRLGNSQLMLYLLTQPSRIRGSSVGLGYLQGYCRDSGPRFGSWLGTAHKVHTPLLPVCTEPK